MIVDAINDISRMEVIAKDEDGVIYRIRDLPDGVLRSSGRHWWVDTSLCARCDAALEKEQRI